MALVGVEHLRLRQSVQRAPQFHGARTADAQQQFLQQSVFAAAAVQAVSDQTQVVGVLGDIGVEQQQAHPANLGLPDPRVQRAVVGKRERYLHGRAVGAAQHGERQPVGVE